MVPASLVTQWRFELRTKFNENFLFHDAAEIARIRGEHPQLNPWDVHPNVICSLQYARMDSQRQEIANARWDLVIVDEAHHARTQIRYDLALPGVGFGCLS